MKLNGALEPSIHHGAPATGSSFGVNKYRDKQCELQSNKSHDVVDDVDVGMTNICMYNNFNNNNNKNKNINNIKNNRNSKGHNKTRSHCIQEQQQQQQHQLIQFGKKASLEWEEKKGEVEDKETGRCEKQQRNRKKIIPKQIASHELHTKYVLNSNNNNDNNNNNKDKDTKKTHHNNNNINATSYNGTVKSESVKTNQAKNDDQFIKQSRGIIVLAAIGMAKDITNAAVNAGGEKQQQRQQHKYTQYRCHLIIQQLGYFIAVFSIYLISLLLWLIEKLEMNVVDAAAVIMSTWWQYLVRRVRYLSYEFAELSLTGLKQRRWRQRLSGTTMNSSQFSSSTFVAFTCCLTFAFILLPSHVRCDDNYFAVNSFNMGPETTTPEFDYASRGQKKIGDKCENTLECGFPGSICDPKKKYCQCTEDLPATNHLDKCGRAAAINESCFFNEQCEVTYFQTECRDGRCICRFEMTPIWNKDGTVECKGRQDKHGPETYVDPAMIGVLVGMALMFIIICVVLRLFSQARWRENRTIFNTPNPRLMNVSLLRDSKLLHGQERRGSRMSVRAPSVASLRPHSPNPSLGKTGSRSNSHGDTSNASATSVRSTRSNSVAPGNFINNGQHERKGSAHRRAAEQQQSLITNITSNPAAESVTVEIIQPEK